MQLDELLATSGQCSSLASRTSGKLNVGARNVSSVLDILSSGHVFNDPPKVRYSRFKPLLRNMAHRTVIESFGYPLPWTPAVEIV